MKYAFIRDHAAQYPIRRLCRAVGASPSGYYAWRNRAESRRSKANRILLGQIEAVHRDSRQTYGPIRIHRELTSQGNSAGLNRIARLKREAGLRTKQTLVWQQAGRGRTFEHIVEHRLLRRFYADRPNERWVADITFIPTAQGWLYLSVIMDLYSRLIVGWAKDKKPSQELATLALEMSLGRRAKPVGLLLHTDQGVQYRTARYQALLAQNDIQPSMSRKGNCHDNAAMESFFHTLKTEHVRHQKYRTFDEARQSLFDYIEVFYNRQRRHSYLAYMTPFEYERLHAVS
ncbi:IS3 family transposase [Stutzerimonas chloritidismutans]